LVTHILGTTPVNEAVLYVDGKIAKVFVFTQGPTLTTYPTTLLDGEDRDGVTIPKLLTAELLDQVPPTGLAVNTKEAVLLQNGPAEVMVGITVFVTDIFNCVLDGQTVGLGVELVLYVIL
jgi:hypothetical protein